MLGGRYGIALATLLTPGCPGARDDASSDVERGADASPVAPSVPPPLAPTPTPWRPIAGLPASCTARVAVDARAVPSLTRRPCNTGRVGCERHELEAGARWLRLGLYEPIFADVRGLHVSYLRAAPLDDPDHGSLSIVQRLDGDARVELAFASPRDGCAVVAHASPQGIALRAIVTAPADSPHHLAWSSWEAPTALTFLAAHPGDDAPLSQHAARSDGVIAVEAMSLDGNVRAAVFRPSDGRFAPLGPELAGLQRPLPSGDGILGLDDERAALVHVAADGTARTRVQRHEGARIVAFALDRTAADTVTWLEQADPADLAASLWTQRADEAMPRRLSASAAPGPVVANAGWIATVASPDLVQIVRAANGETRDVAREPDAAWVYPLWVDDAAVWIATSTVLPGEPGFPVVSGLVRVEHGGEGAAWLR